MAQVIVQFGRGGAPSEAGGITQVLSATRVRTEEVATTTTSQQTTITANADDVAVVTNLGDNLVWVAFGENPTAAPESLHPVPPRETRDFGMLGQGMKAALVDDT